MSLDPETIRAIHLHAIHVRDVIASMKAESLRLHSAVYQSRERSQPILHHDISTAADHEDHMAELLRESLAQLTRAVDRALEQTDPGVRA